MTPNPPDNPDEQAQDSPARETPGNPEDQAVVSLADETTVTPVESAPVSPADETLPHIIKEPGAFGLAAKETTVAPGYSPLSSGGWLNVTVPCSVSTLV